MADAGKKQISFHGHAGLSQKWSIITTNRKALPVEDSEATEVQKLFGFGGPNNVKVTTPEFGYDFDL